MCVLVSLIFSVLSTIAEYEKFANDILYWMVMIVTGWIGALSPPLL